jgi:DNA recombination protein RmuC
MEYFIGFLAGIFVGGLSVYLINRLNKRETEKTFSVLSLEALRKNSEDFLKLANESLSKQAQIGTGELEAKKKLIDQTLEVIRDDLQKVEHSLTDFDVKREKTFIELNKDLKLHAEQTGKLQETTNKLQTALGSSRARGQWGERMAEDVLRLVGFVENINYLKQSSLDTRATRPDYTFLLPQGLKVNMDVKFPLDNYMKFLEEQSDTIKESFRQQFLKDVRQRVKEVTTRDYIDIANDTVDYVLVFIPSEQIYCFIHENDHALLDDSMKQKVILCSPLTLYAMLVVIRQAVENFNLRSTEAKILSLFGTFSKQWDEFKKSMDVMGKKIKQAYDEYDSLTTTRRRTLERPLSQIDTLRREKGILESPVVEDITDFEDSPENHITTDKTA